MKIGSSFFICRILAVFAFCLSAALADPLNNKQSHLNDIGAPKAWQTTQGDPSIIVGVIDTGIRTTHEDLKNSLWQGVGYDFIQHSADVSDQHGHGTHVAGIIGAENENKLGGSGIAPKTKIMVLKVADDRIIRLDAVTEAIYYAIQNGAKILNSSYASCNQTGPLYEPLKKAYQAASDAGILLVFAAGNSGKKLGSYTCFPAMWQFENSITVGSLVNKTKVSAGSNYGPEYVHLLAPGVDILSTWKGDLQKYNRITGTSQAAPMVSAAAALIWAHEPWLTARQVKERILSTSFKEPKYKKYVSSGGRLDLTHIFESSTRTLAQ